MKEIILAIGIHERWKERLSEAARTGVAGDLTPGKVVRRDQCDFGKWLMTLAGPQRRSPRFVQVEEAHAEFHRAASEVVHLILEKHLSQAKQAVEQGRYAAASARLVAELEGWNRELHTEADAA